MSRPPRWWGLKTGERVRDFEGKLFNYEGGKEVSEVSEGRRRRMEEGIL
jgi:hypothetical protein